MRCTCSACTVHVMHALYSCNASYVCCRRCTHNTEQMHCSVKAAGLWHIKLAVVKKEASKEMLLHGLFVTHKFVALWNELTKVSAHVVCIMCQKTAADGCCQTSSRQTQRSVDGYTLHLIMQVCIIWSNKAVPSCSWSRSCPTLALSHSWKLLETG